MLLLYYILRSPLIDNDLQAILLPSLLRYYSTLIIPEYKLGTKQHPFPRSPVPPFPRSPEPAMNKPCPKCHRAKRLGSQPYCEKCLQAYHKAWRQHHRNARALYQKRYRMRKIQQRLKEAMNPTISELGDQL